MLWLKLLQKLARTLNSDGTPGQVAAGLMLGAALGLTPLMNLHNLVIFALGIILNVSFPGVMLGWVAFIPLGFALDPVFDWVGGVLLLRTEALVPLWTAWYDTPVAALTNFNNTVVLGSVVAWVALAVPLFFLFRWGVSEYRDRVYARLVKTRMFQAVRATKIYNLYRLLRPE